MRKMLVSQSQLDDEGVETKVLDPTGFNNWAGKGAAKLILPHNKENPLVAKIRVLEEKVTYLEKAKLSQETRITKLEQGISHLLQGGLSF